MPLTELLIGRCSFDAVPPPHARTPVLLYDEMRKLEESHGDQFKIWHTLSKAPQEGHWEYSVGHLDRGMMEEHIFAPDQEKRENAVFLCGPPGLIKHGALPGLKEMGYEEGTDCFGF